MIGLNFKTWILVAVIATFFATNSSQAQVKPFVPPQPIEGEIRAYSQLLQTLSVLDDPNRLLRSLNLARDMTAGPTLLRAYIDCMRIGPLINARDQTASLIAADDCVSTFPDHPMPMFLRGLARIKSFDDPDLLVAGTDDLIQVFTENPSMYRMMSFDDLASPIRGLTAAGKEQKRAELVKAYFNPLYVPPPDPSTSGYLVSGIGVLLEDGETGLASRLAGFLQSEKDVVGLLSFKPASPIWPALEARHSQGYEASKKAWSIMNQKSDTFDLQKVSLLSALSLWDELQEKTRDAIKRWDGIEDNADEIVLVNKSSINLWAAGLEEESFELTRMMLAKARPDTAGQVTNLAFNAGHQMILSGRVEEGRQIMKPFIEKTEKNPDSIEWQSGSAFLNAVRVCAYEGKAAQKALRILEQSSGDLFAQKNVAYGCLHDADKISKLKADRLSSGPMVNRITIAIELVQQMDRSASDPNIARVQALKLDPLKSAVDQFIRPLPKQ
ncbi:MAG: hypothetical protein Pars2KO_14020 [Parasphingorhabdus sp.]